MIHGDRDTIVPLEQVKIYTEKAKNSGDDAEVRIVENAGHYELIAPQTQAFSLVRQAALELLQMQ